MKYFLGLAAPSLLRSGSPISLRDWILLSRSQWPEAYINQYKQPFNPWTFVKNALALCNYLKGDARS
jgi:hypothetical protein